MYTDHNQHPPFITPTTNIPAIHARTTRRNKGPSPVESIYMRPPKLSNQICIPFPDRKLPVCLTCKRNYKTRELCRTRDQHTALPWTTTYICITFSETCYDRNRNIFTKAHFRAKSMRGQQPYCFQRNMDATTAICHACKEKNYTRHYCREKLQHRQLPWPCAYILLSLDMKGEDDLSKGSTITTVTDDVRSLSQSPRSEKSISLSFMTRKDIKNKRETSNIIEESEESTVTLQLDTSTNPNSDIEREELQEKLQTEKERPKKKLKQEEYRGEKNQDEDDALTREDEESIFLTKVPSSCSFLAIVSAISCTYEWLDEDKNAPSHAKSVNENTTTLVPYYQRKKSLKIVPPAEPPIQGLIQEYPPYYNYPSMIQKTVLRNNYTIPRQFSFNQGDGCRIYTNVYPSQSQPFKTTSTDFLHKPRHNSSGTSTYPPYSIYPGRKIFGTGEPYRTDSCSDMGALSEQCLYTHSPRTRRANGPYFSQLHSPSLSSSVLPINNCPTQSSNGHYDSGPLSHSNPNYNPSYNTTSKYISSGSTSMIQPYQHPSSHPSMTSSKHHSRDLHKFSHQLTAFPSELPPQNVRHDTTGSAFRQPQRSDTQDVIGTGDGLHTSAHTTDGSTNMTIPNLPNPPSGGSSTLSVSHPSLHQPGELWNHHPCHSGIS